MSKSEPRGPSGYSTTFSSLTDCYPVLWFTSSNKMNPSATPILVEGRGCQEASPAWRIRDSALTWVVTRALASFLQLVGVSNLGARPPLGEEEPAREDKGEVGGVWVAPSSRPSGQVVELEKETDKQIKAWFSCGLVYTSLGSCWLVPEVG